MTAFSKPLLPQELIEMIIDHVASDSGSLSGLCTCARVCKSWVPHTRAQIFHTVKFSNVTLPDRLKAFDNPQVANRVRTLVIRRILPRSSGDADKEWVDRIASHLKSMDRVSALLLYNLQEPEDLFDLEGKFRLYSLPSTTTVTSLTLSHVKFPSLSALITVFEQFGHLTKLGFDYVVWSRGATEKPTTHSLLPLRSLRIGWSTSSSEVVKWLMRRKSSDPLQIESLDIAWAYEDSGMLLQQILHSVSATLKHLSIDMYWKKLPSRPMEATMPDGWTSLLTSRPYLLSKCSNLHALEFSVLDLSSTIMNARENTPVHKYDWMFSVLSHADTRQIRQITFHLFHNDFYYLDQFDFAQLDNILADWKNLTSLKFIVTDGMCWGNSLLFISALRERVPSLSARGVVKVERRKAGSRPWGYRPDSKLRSHGIRMEDVIPEWDPSHRIPSLSQRKHMAFLEQTHVKKQKR